MKTTQANYNASMEENPHHSRRTFLKGQSAVRLLADKATSWMGGVESFGSSSELHPSNKPLNELAAVHLLASRRAMACDFQVQYHAADGPEATNAMVTALDIVDAIEDQLTVYRDTSDVATINTHAGQGPMVVEEQLYNLLNLSQQLCQKTNGAFDITSGPLSRIWGFLQRTGRLPDQTEIDIARSWVGIDQWHLDSDQQTITLKDSHVEVNFNAIGKGYALDQAAQWLDTQNIDDYLWHGGRSSVLARGHNRSGPDQRVIVNQQKQDHDELKPAGWTVGLPNPLQPKRRLAEIHLHNRALATAGSNTQFFIQDGTHYGHLIDPRTGWPANHVITATVIATTAAEADALATAFHIMGPDQTDNYCQQHTQVKAILVCPAKQKTNIEVHAFGMTPDDWTLLEE